jgi:hypothetical protein
MKIVVGSRPKYTSQQSRSKREMPIAEVVRPLDLVDYQEGSVVSRALVNRTSCSERSSGPPTLEAFFPLTGIQRSSSMRGHGRRASK